MHPFQASRLKHTFTSCAWICAFWWVFLPLILISLVRKTILRRRSTQTRMQTFLGKMVSLRSGKCINSCQHFCSVLDWALCSAVTPLQEASSSPNSRAICPGSRLATSIPTHPCQSVSGIMLWVLGLNMFPRLEENRLCLSACRPEMRMHPLMRTLFCPVLCEQINPGFFMLCNRSSIGALTPCSKSKMSAHLFSQQWTSGEKNEER